MRTEPVFTTEELRSAGLRTVDALAETLRDGDREAARRLVKRFRREVLLF
jgi:hypothetical protein